MPRSSKAPRFVGNRDIQLVERTYPDPGPGQLLMTVRANAVCGTDRGPFIRGSEVIAGHEAAGEVAARGEGCTTLLGARGVIYFKDFCGTCANCAIGHTSLCLDKRASVGMDRDGGYGPWVLISERQFFPVPESVPLPLATMLLDAMGTTGHAVDRARSIRSDINSVYIAGAGPIGLGLLVQCGIRLSGGVPVYISDVSGWRRDFAQSLGGIPVDATDPAAVRAIAPVDVSFDSTGKAAARQLAIDVLGSRGVFMVVGGQEGFSFSDVGEELLPRELSILGSEYFDFKEFDRNLSDLLQHRALIERLVTHTFPIEKLDEAFETFLAGETGKVVVTQEGVAR